EQPAHAVANGYFVGAINRVGTEAPWNVGKFYGSSYFVDPRGNFVAQANENDDALVVAEMDLDMIEEVRSVWQFFRGRPPGTYEDLVQLQAQSPAPRSRPSASLERSKQVWGSIMTNDPRPNGRPSAGEQFGGLIGCVALLIALALLIGLTFRSFLHHGA